MTRILVLGGSGFVGRALCERLSSASASARIVVPTRSGPRGDDVKLLPTVDLHVADINDPAALARLVAGSTAVVNLVAILHGSQEAFDRAHVELPRSLVQACRNAGVGRIVHVSALGVGDDPAAAPSRYLRSKGAGEALLRGAGLEVTVLRPSVIFGAHARFLNLFAQLQGFAPVLPLAASGARFQPVWVEDVAEAVARCLQRPQTAGQTYECTGPDVFTLSEIVRLAGRWAGRERPQIPLPAWAGRLQAMAMEWLPGEPLMSRDNLDSMQRPNVASARQPGLRELGITPSAMAAVAPAYLGDLFGRPKLDRWRALAGRQ
jgi:uncharacterized protein YbjT (DUF2867 family)